MTLVDTNVLLDLVTRDPRWAAWSLSALDAAAMSGAIAINDVVYAEFSGRYESIQQLDAFVTGAGLQHIPTPRSALFLAGKVYRRYRTSGGQRTGVLPDFFIGAHAAVSGLPLLTRDARRYRSYFPTVTLITPET